MTIDGDRLLSRLDALSRIGRTEDGGVTRLALSAEDTEARALVVGIAVDRGYECRADAMGNVFLRRPGTDPDAAPVVTGSHLDTQRDGGNYDGIYGVLAGLEVLESLDDARVATVRPVELVIWNNEEGVRFSPVTMGSGVHGGFLDGEEIARGTDTAGVTVAEALAADAARLPKMEAMPYGRRFHAYVEAHIEQGPVLEAEGIGIGVVTGIQGVRQMRFIVRGGAAHAGTTPASVRRDAFAGALALHDRLQTIAVSDDPDVRFTIGQFQLLPGTPNTVPGEARFSVDLRHPDAAVLAARGNAMLGAEQETWSGCAVEVTELIHSAPLLFADKITSTLADEARTLGLPALRMISGATHDARNVAHLGDTGMIFVPSRDGISHNPAEWTDPTELDAGARLLAATLIRLANERS